MSNKAEPEWTSLHDAMAMIDSAIGYEDQPFSAMTKATAESVELAIRHNEYCHSVYAWLSIEGCAGTVRFMGVKVLNRSLKNNGPLVPIPTEFFRTARDFRDNEIESYSTAPTESANEYAIKVDGGERHPSWIDVVINTKGLKERLNLFARDYFLGKIANGEMQLDEVDRKLRDAGLAMPDVEASRAELGSAEKPPIKKSLKKKLLGYDVMKDWARNHMLENKECPTSRKDELALLAEENPDHRISRATYIKARRSAAEGNRMEYWCARGPKKGGHGNLSEIGRVKLADKLRDDIKISKKTVA